MHDRPSPDDKFRGKTLHFFSSLFPQINAGKLRVLLIYSRDSVGGGTGGRRAVCVE